MSRYAERRTSALRSIRRAGCGAGDSRRGFPDFAAVAGRSRELIEAAHARTLGAEELAGGTFTISSLGAFGIDAFTPILNYPEVAVLGVGTIRKEAVVAE